MVTTKPLTIVTGANSGVGKAVASGLLQENEHHVILACRRREACLAAREELLNEHPNSSCECRHLDLNDYSTIRNFSEEINRDFYPQQPLELLINNAAVIAPPVSADNENNNGEYYDPHLIPNHYGPYLLTRCLLPSMAKNGKIVTVGSNAHFRAQLEFNDTTKKLQPVPTWHWYFQYARSKLLNAVMTAELSRRLTSRGSSIQTCCVSPGRVNTSIFNNVPLLANNPVVRFVMANFLRTPQQGARTVLYAAKLPELKGKCVPFYLHDEKELAPSAKARDEKLGRLVWELSVRETGMSVDEDEKLWPAQ